MSEYTGGVERQSSLPYENYFRYDVRLYDGFSDNRINQTKN
jgi:hypothetical protein